MTHLRTDVRGAMWVEMGKILLGFYVLVHVPL